MIETLPLVLVLLLLCAVAALSWAVVMLRDLRRDLKEQSGLMQTSQQAQARDAQEAIAGVRERLSAIDAAQHRIDNLASSVVSLQALLGSQHARGALGEKQLEAAVRDLLPTSAFTMQHTFPNGTRVDCALFLPEPTGTVAVDSKFPLENFRRMCNQELPESERTLAQRQFGTDVKKHVDDIAAKYIIPGVTSDGAVMFVPSEAVYSEIHARYPEVVDHATARRVWVVSPTTLMAVLNAARAVLRDKATRDQAHVIKEHLARLGQDFTRFDARMQKLADHIRQAHEDTQEIHTSGQKISRRFSTIQSLELEAPADASPRIETLHDKDE